jgi:hypothetical protein
MAMRFMMSGMAVLALSAGWVSAAGQESGTRAVSFSKEVMSLLKDHCLKCHDEKEKKGGLIMDTYEKLMKGKAGIVKAGDPKNSVLIQKVTGNKPEMPKNAPPLEPSQVRTLTNWIKEGAKNN